MSSQAVSKTGLAIAQCDHLPRRCLFAVDLARSVLIFSPWALFAIWLVALRLKLMRLAVFAPSTRQVSAGVAYRADSFVRSLAPLSAANAAVAAFCTARFVGQVLVLAFGAVGAGTVFQRIDEAARRAVDTVASSRFATRLPCSCRTLRAIDTGSLHGRVLILVGLAVSA